MKLRRTLLATLSVFYHGDILSCETNEQEITPYKFQTYEELETSPYEIPKGSRLTTPRDGTNTPDIIYYFSKPPSRSNYPITLFCGGSSTKENAGSIIHVHRYFLEEFLSLGSAVITVEQWGVDGPDIARDIFMAHYTRTQRLQDHQQTINHLKNKPPHGWNGQFVLVGVSEGGPLVTKLTEENQDTVVATMNWSGAGDFSWRDELWAFIQAIEGPPIEGAQTREEFDTRFNNLLLEPPAPGKEFFGMSYLYHTDASTYPPCQYGVIKTPFLVIAGAQDSLIHSADAFVNKAKEAGMDITYMRVEDMGHLVRKRLDIVGNALEWLQSILERAAEKKALPGNS